MKFLCENFIATAKIIISDVVSITWNALHMAGTVCKKWRQRRECEIYWHKLSNALTRGRVVPHPRHLPRHPWHHHLRLPPRVTSQRRQRSPANRPQYQPTSGQPLVVPPHFTHCLTFLDGGVRVQHLARPRRRSEWQHGSTISSAWGPSVQARHQQQLKESS